MKTAYFDCFSGISGDMCLGALISAGASLSEIKKELAKLPLKGYKLTSKKVKRSGIEATRAVIEVTGNKQPLRRWKDIKNMIQKSSLPPDIKQKGLGIFKSLFEAEAVVHGTSCEQVHLHELGAADCIIDIVGTLLGLKLLGIRKVYSSPVNLGSGQIKTEHGCFSVPAPATAELLRGIPVYCTDPPYELTTPTGAAILKGVSSGFGNIPLMRVDRIGAGAGTREIKGRANILRILVSEAGRPSRAQDITVLETNIDDMNPQIYEYVMDRLFREGALEVYLTQVIMKKGRPGVKLTVLCPGDRRQRLTEVIFRETTTIGLRFWSAERTVLERTIKKTVTELGKIRVKEARLPDGTLKATPEYEDCKRAAKRHNIPLLETIRRAGRKTG